MELRRKRKIDIKRVIGAFLFVTLILSIVYIIIKMIIAPTEAANDVTKVKSDYVLMLLQCVLGIFVMMIPSFVEKKKAIDIPDPIEIIYFIFLYCAIYLGEVHNFYYLIPYWDSILHAFSGAVLGVLGIILVRFLNEGELVDIQLNPFFISFFAFCFAVAAGTIWEIYEFLADGMLSLNMQKFILVDGTQLIGREALYDTMMDLILDTVSALIISLIAYPILKKQTVQHNTNSSKIS
ncbi:hypothetical protein HHO41_20320 [Bacillus sp. DNRA2]|uniref:hypothetical protein n=1 Tax=Bacillus sp. DNRA2 TaxID=2723053 RepID=UPI00145DAD03|nr:hypothetical protein [Bacillus sp. DNRA2]NMD72586.1 hypothetical protein [Bacillus sp. DNRA2]